MGSRARNVSARSVILLTAALCIVTLCVAFLSLLFGTVQISASSVIAGVYSLFGTVNGVSQEVRSIVLEIRLPRVLLALFVGGGLSVAGSIFQVLLRNVLADPYILGISGGASVGALLAIAAGWSAMALITLPACAFAGALLVSAAVYLIGMRKGIGDPNALLLTGVMFSAILSAIILGVLTMIGDPVRNALFWLIGYLGNADMAQIALIAPVTILLAGVLISRSRAMNILAFGQDTARALGLPMQQNTMMTFAAASLLTAVLVSFSGSIGFVGLIVPHIGRRVFGSDHRVLLPTIFFTGAIFLMISDLLARTIFQPLELPVGAITAAVGAPLFLFLLKKKA